MKKLALLAVLLMTLPLFAQSLTEQTDSGWVDSSGFKSSYPPRQRSVVYKNDTGKTVIATILLQSMTDAQRGITEESSEERTVVPGATLTLNSWENWDSVVSNEMLWNYASLGSVKYEPDSEPPKTVDKKDQTVIIQPSSKTITAGTSVPFDAVGAADANCVWGGAASGSGRSKTVTFNSVGTYSVTVSHPGNDTYNPSNTATATVTVQAAAAATASISVSPASATVSAGGKASTTVTWSASNATSVVVTGPGGFSQYSSNGSAVSASFGVGTYTFTITAANPVGTSVSQSATFTVSETSKVSQTVSITPASSSITAGQSITFTATGGVDSGYSWGGNASGTGASKTVTFNAPGTYSVTVQHPGNTKANASNVATANITVKEAPVVEEPDEARLDLYVSEYWVNMDGRLVLQINTKDEVGVDSPYYLKSVVWTIPSALPQPVFDFSVASDSSLGTVMAYYKIRPLVKGTFPISVALTTMGKTLRADRFITVLDPEPTVSANWIYPEGRSNYPYYQKGVNVDITGKSADGVLSITELTYCGEKKVPSGAAPVATARFSPGFTIKEYLINWPPWEATATSANKRWGALRTSPIWERPNITMSFEFDKPYYYRGEVARFRPIATDQYGNVLNTSPLTDHLRPTADVFYYYKDENDDWAIRNLHIECGSWESINTNDISDNCLNGYVYHALVANPVRTNPSNYVYYVSGATVMPIVDKIAPTCFISASPSKVTAPGTTNIYYRTLNLPDATITGPNLTKAVGPNDNGMSFVISYPEDAQGGVYTYTLSGKDWQGKTVSASASVTVIGTAVTPTLLPLVSDYTVTDASHPAYGKSYKRVWQEGAGWAAYLGRAGVRFKASAPNVNAAVAAELQGQEPGGAWATLATAALSGTGSVEHTFSVRLGEMSVSNAWVPASYEAGAPKTGAWLFRARFQEEGGTWGKWSEAVSVSVVLPLATVSETVQTIPPAGGDGAWFKASKARTFSLPVWIP